MSGARFELAVFDEAHVMAGRETKAKKYSFGLDDSRIALERRLFFTATPRRYKQPGAARGEVTNATATAAAVGERGESTVMSMDNVTAFGPVVYQMTHQQAVNKGIVAPLEILVYNVTDGYADMCRRHPKVRGRWLEVGGWWLDFRVSTIRTTISTTNSTSAMRMRTATATITS
jgi:predicted helicase